MFKKITLILFFIILLNYNYPYEIVNQETKITHYKFDIYKITENINLEYIVSDTIEFSFVPCYDIIIKLNNQRYFDFTYTTDKITIHLNERNEKIKIELIYLTDYYTSKNNNIWSLNYKSQNTNLLNNLQITLPKNIELKDTTPKSSSTKINKKQFVLLFENINEININYNIKAKKKTIINNYILILSFIITISFVLIFKKKKKKNTEKYLLGLNKNEQKIMKIIIEKEGQSQKSITLKSYLPKGTVSRNIKSLVDKGYIEIKKYGISNKLFLGEIYKKK